MYNCVMSMRLNIYIQRLYLSSSKENVKYICDILLTKDFEKDIYIIYFYHDILLISHFGEVMDIDLKKHSYLIWLILFAIKEILGDYLTYY